MYINNILSVQAKDLQKSSFMELCVHITLVKCFIEKNL